MRTPVLSLWVLLLSFGVYGGLAAQNCQAAFSFGETGLTIAFNDESTSTPGDPIISWFWDFDDGAGSTLQNPAHTFPTADRYDVCLTITTQNNCTGQLCARIETCVLDVSVTAGSCNANDQIPAVITVNDLFDNAGDIDISVDGQLLPGSPFSIDINQPVTVNATVPGDGLSHVVTVQSQDIGTCSTTRSFTVPDCSSNCFLSGMNINVAGGGAHIVQVGDNFFSPQNTTINIGDAVEFQWVGDGHSTTSDAASGPDSWNSGVIGFGSVYTVNIANPGVHRYYCIPHGGPNGQGMSGMIVANCPPGGQFALQVSFNTTIAAPAGYNVLLDGAPVAGSPFSYSGAGPQSNTLNIAGDGVSHSIQIQDVADPSCIISRTYTAPDCGAAPACSIFASATQAGGCTAGNQTPVELAVNAVNGGASGFNVYIDGNLAPGGPFAYNPSGPALLTVNVPGDGQSHIIAAEDIDNPNCVGVATLTTTNCSLGCVISGLELTTAASGNPIVHLIEVKDFEFVPAQLEVSVGDIVRFEWTGVIAHTSTSDATSGPDSWDSGLLGQGSAFEVTITTEGLHAYYCIPHGAPGGVGMSGAILASPPCDGGNIALNVRFDAVGGAAAGYNLLLDNELYPGSPFNYAVGAANNLVIGIPGDGRHHMIRVEDAANSGCSAESGILAPDCAADQPCSLSLQAVVAGGCDDNGEAPVELTIISEGAGNHGFIIQVDGNLYQSAPFSYDPGGTTHLTIFLTGTGNERLIKVQDIDSTACFATAMAATSLCGPLCEVQNLAVNSGRPGRHIVEVKDFEFFPAQLETIVGDTVEFLWKGSVLHTSTSDVTSGPNSWNSGLLGLGASYRVVITEAGAHPYYCIPHGGPGGIGMSGVIHALEPCDNGIALATIGFTTTNGSSNGYNVFLDGEYLAGPVAYNDDMGYNSMIVRIPGDSAQHVLTVQDLDVSYCAASAAFTAPRCEVLCLMNNLSVATGADVVHTVYVEDFRFNPSVLNVRVGETLRFIWTGQIPHTTTSDAISGPDSWDSGLLGQGSTYDLVITGPGSHPYYCIPHGGPGGIGMSGVIHATPDCQDDSIFVAVGFEVSSGSDQGYNLFIDGAPLPGNPYSYDNPMGANRIFIQMPGDGAIHLATIQDVETPFCAATGQLAAPDCSAACAISGLTVNFPENRRHLVEVLDFEFLPKDLTVTVGDTIEFFWTGAIPHTSTSDATSGIDSWDSGLLGQGAAFEVSIHQAGQHPYYCIPHGGPGGIGMAGMITALPACQGDSVLASLSFQGVGGSGSFLLLIDGQEAGQYSYHPSGNNELEALFYGDGLNHEISIQDAGQPACSASLEATVLQCAELCLLQAIATQTGSCDENMEVPYELSISSNNPESEGFRLLLDGNVYPGGPFAYNPGEPTVLELHIAGDGAIHQLVLEDISLPGCSQSFELQLPNCQEPCAGFIPAFSYVADGQDSLFIAFTDQTAGNAHQWLWGFGDGATSNAQNPFHTYSQPGFYTVCLLAQDTLLGCNQAACQVIPVGLASTKGAGARQLPLHIYPNPARRDARSWMVEGLAPADYFRLIRFEAYGPRGERILEGWVTGGKVTEIPIQSPIPAGMYLLELYTPDNSYRGRVIVH